MTPAAKPWPWSSGRTYPLAEVARRLGVNPEVFRKWKLKYAPPAPAVEDLYSRAIVGEPVSDTPDTGLVRRAWDAAETRQRPGSDRALGPEMPIHECRVPPDVGRPRGRG